MSGEGTTTTAGPLAAHPRLVALVLALCTVAWLAIGHRDVGYVRDEGIYFEASRSYAAWLGDLARAPGKALAREGRDRRFRANHEHPALLKLLAGASAKLFAHPPVEGTRDEDVVDDGGLVPVMPEGAAMRLPAQVLAGLAVALLYLVAAATGGPWAGVLAAGGFVLLPHVAFHAGLHAFDVPVAVAMLAVVLLWRRALVDRRAGVAIGVVLGIAIAVKHNALFLGPLLALHHWSCLAIARWRDGRRIGLGQIVPLPLVSMAVLAPLVAFALWPWLWADPWARVVEYFEFHRQHAYYNMEFLGRNYNQPPMPVAYPFVMTWATVPTCLLVLVGIGAVVTVRRDFSRAGTPVDAAVQASFSRPLPDPWGRHDGLLFVLLAVFPIALIALPSTPIFGGTKHWITAYPFFALLAARAWTWLWSHAALASRRRLEPAALVVVLGPAAIATVDGHPYNLSQYVSACGGARGAAELGLNRGFWGTAIAPALPHLADTLHGARRIYVHDMDIALPQYRREGRWPLDLASVPIQRAEAGLLFHEMHMTTYEQQLWDRLGTTAPVQVLVLDGVPLTSVYVAPR